MWFVFVTVGLVLVGIVGTYASRRLAGALAQLGVRERRIRVVRWLLRWLLFGFPIVMVISIVISLLLGSSTLPRFDGLLGAWLLAFPFAWAVLVVMQSLPWLIAIDVAYLVTRRRNARLRAAAVLAVLGAFALYTPLRILAQRDELRVRHHRIGIGTGATPPFRIAFVADVQQDAHTDAHHARDVYEVVNAAWPDVVLSGGDWINAGPDYIKDAAKTATMLKSRYGTFSVRGDHEHFAYLDRNRSVSEIEQAMRDHGITMLNNDVRWFEHANGKRIAVVFLNYNYIHRTDSVTIATLVASVAHADYRIAVTHQLDDRLATLLENQVDLILAGHTHGGQVNPVLGLVHVNLARLETEYVDGRYRRGNTEIIVTAGVGYSIVPFRYAAPGSIELLQVSP